MNPISSFLVDHFALFCVAIGLTSIAIQNLRSRRRESILSLIIVGFVFILVAIWNLEKYGKSIGDITLATVFAYFGYVVRPIVLFLFIRLADKARRPFFIFYTPLIINAIVYSFALFTNVDSLKHLIYYYELEGGVAVFHRGTILCFFSHFVSILYLGYLMYLSFDRLKGKHYGDAFAIIVCAIFTVAAVITESIFSNKNINLLNVTIAISALFYYLYLFVENSRNDALTGLFDRKTYYADLKKLEKNINGIIVLDMNGLKYINDNFGHLEGDEALRVVGETISKSCHRKCYIYRLGGDEFTVLVVNCNEDFIIDIVDEFKKRIETTKYHCSIGYAYRNKKDEMNIEDLIKKAEQEMYNDKELFYQNSHIERRRSNER